MIVPPILAAAIVGFGWRAGLYAMAAITGLVGLPVALLLIGRTREATARSNGAVPPSEGIASGPAATRSATLREAVRGTRFWLLALALAAVNIAGSGIVAQLAPLLADKGLSESAAALVMSTYAVGLLIGRVITGFALDRVPSSTVGAVMTFIPAAGIVLLRLPSSSFKLAAAAVAMIGLQQGSEVDLIAYLVSRSFGVTHYGAIYGAVAVAGAASTAISFVFFGRVHDVTGSYDVALTAGAAAFCCGAVAFMAIGRVR